VSRFPFFFRFILFSPRQKPNQRTTMPLPFSCIASLRSLKTLSEQAYPICPFLLTRTLSPLPLLSLGWTITHSRMQISFVCAEKKGRKGRITIGKRCRSYTFVFFCVSLK
jgi:hypothetical protein